MQDRQLYAQILGIGDPWRVTDVELQLAKGQVVVRIGRLDSSTLTCPVCDQVCPGYDTQVRQWRHLDTCQYETILEAAVPRCACPEHGVKQVAVPWAERGSRFTALFERLAIDWMREVGRTAVARRMRITWSESHGIMRRAVRRGLSRRKVENYPVLGVDEKSFQKGHEYVTMVNDLARHVVLYVGDDRTQASLDAFYDGLTDAQKNAVEAVAMDMCQAYVSSTTSKLPDGASKIVFDKFHIAKMFSEAVDRIRREENKRLRQAGDDRLVGTRYAWLRNPQNESAEQARSAQSIRTSLLATARAWRLKETFMDFFTYRYPANAKKFFDRWYAWASRSRLEPMKKVATTLKGRLANLLTYCRMPITNAVSESLNAKIQWIKYTARGFRSRDGFKTAILFHCGGLDLYPTTHTNS
jgi:transposase